MKKFTPRQKVAIAYPITDGRLDVHPRHHKVNGDIQSILTFDVTVAPPPDVCPVCKSFASNTGQTPEEASADCYIHQYGKNARIGFWHARATMYPAAEYESWDSEAFERARKVLKRLVAKVGREEEVSQAGGKDGLSLHFFRTATISEVAQAVRASEGSKRLH